MIGAAFAQAPAASGATTVIVVPGAAVPAAASSAGEAAGGASIMAELGRIVGRLLRQETLIELAVLAGCIGLAWIVVKALRRALRVDGDVLFGRRVVDGALFPLFALAFAFIARAVLRDWFAPALLRIAIPVLLSLAVIRFIVRVLSAALPGTGWVRFVERTVSWLAWIAVVLWITGILPVALAQLEQLSWKIGGTQVSLRNIVEGIISAGLVMVVALWVSAAVERRLVSATGSGNNLSLRIIAARLVRVLLLVVGVLFAMSAVGIDITALSVLGGAIGVGLGFGLQKIAANYVSGFVILAERSLRVGDMVKIDGFEGRVSDIRTRYTVVRSLDGRESIIPNEHLITHRVENASLADPRVMASTTVTVAYGTDLDALVPKLVAAMNALPRVLDEPPPGVQLSRFGSDGLDLIITFWIEDPQNGQMNVRSEVNFAVLRCLNEAGVEIPFPQRVVHRARARPATAAAGGDADAAGGAA